jgi:hypothetical protein
LSIASSSIKGRRRKNNKKTDVPTYLPFLRFFEIFRSGLESICMVFMGSLCRETAKKRDKKKSMGKDESKKGGFFLNFFGQKFLI